MDIIYCIFIILNLSVLHQQISRIGRFFNAHCILEARNRLLNCINFLLLLCCFDGKFPRYYYLGILIALDCHTYLYQFLSYIIFIIRLRQENKQQENSRSREVDCQKNGKFVSHQNLVVNAQVEFPFIVNIRKCKT